MPRGCRSTCSSAPAATTCTRCRGWRARCAPVAPTRCCWPTTTVHRSCSAGSPRAWPASASSLIAAHAMDLVPRGERVLPSITVGPCAASRRWCLLTPSQLEYLRRHEGVGARPWSRTREVVIPNGIAVPPAPTAADRTRARAELGLPDDAFVVGIVARLSAEKAHEVLLEAYAELAPPTRHGRPRRRRRWAPRGRAARPGRPSRDRGAGAVHRPPPRRRGAVPGVRRGLPVLGPRGSADRGDRVDGRRASRSVATDVGAVRDLVANRGEGIPGAGRR